MVKLLVFIALALFPVEQAYSQNSQSGWGNEIFFRTILDDSAHQTSALYSRMTKKWGIVRIAYSSSELLELEPNELSRYRLSYTDGSSTIHEFTKFYLFDKIGERGSSFLLEEDQRFYGLSEDGKILKQFDRNDVTALPHYQLFQSDTCYFYSDGKVKYALPLEQ